MIVIRAEYARLIQPFVSTESTSCYLCGFFVTPHQTRGAYIVATDGHRMGVFHDAEAVCDEPAIVKLDKPALATLKDERGTDLRRYLAVDVKADTATVHLGDTATPRGPMLGTFSKVVVDGAYPDFRRLVPRFEQTPKAGSWYNAKYLAAFGKVCEGAQQSIAVYASDPGAPALVLTDRTDFFGIVMPLRGRLLADGTPPAWWTEAPRAKDAA